MMQPHSIYLGSTLKREQQLSYVLLYSDDTCNTHALVVVVRRSSSSGKRRTTTKNSWYLFLIYLS